MAVILIACSAAAKNEEVWLTPASAPVTPRTGSALTVVHDAAEFDGCMAALPENSRIHLTAGVFHTVKGVSLKSGCWLAGEGMDRTIILLDDIGSRPIINGGFSVIVSAPPRIHGAGVSDLTVDCNFQGQSLHKAKVGIGAVALNGTDLRLSSVKAINFGSTGREDFVLALCHDDWATSDFAIATNLIIDGCVVTQPASNSTFPGGFGCIVIYGIPKPLSGGGHEGESTPITRVGTGWVTRAEVKNCRVCGIMQSGGALGVNYVAQCDIVNNTITNCPNAFGFYSENPCFEDLSIVSNTFDGVKLALAFSPQHFRNVRLKRGLSVRDNMIRNCSYGGIGLGRTLARGPWDGYTNVTIQNNRIYMASSTPGRAIYVGATEHLTMAGNVIDNRAAEGGFQAELDGAPNARIVDNHNVDGSSLSILYNQTAVKPSQRHK